MSEVLRQFLWDFTDDAAPSPPRRMAADWPLMGDIVTHRMDMPEHLIRWRRASGEEAGPHPSAHAVRNR